MDYTTTGLSDTTPHYRLPPDPEGPDTRGQLLTLEELAGKLKMHPETVRGLKRRGVIPAIKLGHRTMRFEYDKVLETLRSSDT